MQKDNTEKYMREAIKQAKKAAAIGEVPIGCVIVRDGTILARGYNRRNIEGSTLAHAEIIAIKKASKKLQDWRLEDCELYVTSLYLSTPRYVIADKTSDADPTF